ncbi:hypothetical protein AB3329_10665 [Streptococcus sp. H31]|uniref:Lin0368 family putative glycerol transporter subunit n=1 Tax=Streptococcus huangxiaojuni TaxID=3237239 RepID=UPI0034A5553C
MTISQILLTVLGGFALPFAVLLIWGRLVLKWHALGGFMAALVIIGPIWLLNHGIPAAFIKQAGPVFIDMGLATDVGVYVHGLLAGGKIKQSWLNVLAALFGGILAGFVLNKIF